MLRLLLVALAATLRPLPAPLRPLQAGLWPLLVALRLLPAALRHLLALLRPLLVALAAALRPLPAPLRPLQAALRPLLAAPLPEKPAAGDGPPRSPEGKPLATADFPNYSKLGLRLEPILIRDMLRTWGMGDSRVSFK